VILFIGIAILICIRLINKVNEMYIFLRMLLSAGLPKIPFFGIPFIIFYMIRDVILQSKFLRSRVVINYYFVVLIVFGLYFIRFLVSESSVADLNFIVTLFFKFVCAPFLGYYLAVAYEKGLAVYFLITHLIILVLAIISPHIYQLLLYFQSVGVRDVFVDLNGMRAISFGLLHNEGAMFIAVNFYFLIINKYKMTRLLSFASFLFMAMSRLTGLLLVVILFFRNFRALSLLCITCSLTIMVLGISESLPEILEQAFEPVIYLFRYGSFDIPTIVHMFDMFVLPLDLATWVYGDGLFFEESGLFYMFTDLGFLRLIYFGGLAGLLLFVILNIFPVFFGLERGGAYYTFLILFFLANIKGLNPHPWMFFLLYFFQLRRFSAVVS
jgi:hypothetical protein